MCRAALWWLPRELCGMRCARAGQVGNKDLPYGGVWVINAFMGLVRAIVRTEAGTPGTVTVHADSPGLKVAAVSFAAR